MRSPDQPDYRYYHNRKGWQAARPWGQAKGTDIPSGEEATRLAFGVGRTLCPDPESILPKRNYGYEKRQKELNKQRKQEEKRQRKLERAEAPAEDGKTPLDPVEAPPLPE
jgi:hypothetical protein